METREAILAYSQSEKAKVGLLMAAQLIEMCNGMPDHEKHAAERFLRPLMGMIANEVHLSRKMTSAEMWASVDKSLNTGAGDDELRRLVRSDLPCGPGHQRSDHHRPARHAAPHASETDVIEPQRLTCLAAACFSGA